jgi:hypothetical protein
MIITNITPVNDAVSQQERLAVAPTHSLGPDQPIRKASPTVRAGRPRLDDAASNSLKESPRVSSSVKPRRVAVLLQNLVAQSWGTRLRVLIGPALNTLRNLLENPAPFVRSRFQIDQSFFSA